MYTPLMRTMVLEYESLHKNHILMSHIYVDIPAPWNIWALHSVDLLQRFTDPLNIVESLPRCSMYGIFAYIWVTYGVNVGKY